jgi:aryl-alcohol dehydrogenase-like predicted oxidoreductase
MQTEYRTESLQLSQKFKAHAESRGLAPSHMALAWALNNRLVAGVIGGPRTLAQWQDYLASAKVQIGPEDEAFVDSLVPPGHASTPGYTDPAYPVTGRVPRSGAG